MIYLDNNATTVLKPEVIKAMQDALLVYGNPSSVHAAGREARMLMDKARRQVGDLVNVRAEQVVFTSGGTESIVAALRGVMSMRQGKRLLTTATEHSATVQTAQALHAEGLAQTYILNVDKAGVVDLDDMKKQLEKGNVALVSIMHANNETGVMQPIEEIIELAHSYNALVHVDACQTVGKIPVDFTALGADLLSISFHKLAGPKGVGALIVKSELEMHALVTGGGQERNRRSGTENVCGIVGAGECSALAAADLEKFAHKKEMQKTLENALRVISNEIEIVGESADRMPHTTMVVTPGAESETMVMSLDIEGFAVSSGSACSSGRIEPSRVLTAQGYSEEKALCGLRIAFGWQTTLEEVEAFAEAFKKVYTRMIA